MQGGNFEVTYPDADDLELVATDEESKIHPSSVYGITKQNQEQMVLTVCKAIGIAGVAFTLSERLRAGAIAEQPVYTIILSIFSSLIKNGKEINIFEDGKESRDFVFIDDVVAANDTGAGKQ